jgi:hypothetical protein
MQRLLAAQLLRRYREEKSADVAALFSIGCFANFLSCAAAEKKVEQ